VDIGSGLGGLLIELARTRPEGSYTGIEIAPLPWLVSRTRAAIAKLSVDFLRGDYESLDLGEYDMVFAYLSPAAMPALWVKAKQEMQPGSFLLSLEFPVPGIPPDRVIHPAGRVPALYVWNF
jgi:SAM-dependent methyltransferase